MSCQCPPQGAGPQIQTRTICLVQHHEAVRRAHSDATPCPKPIAHGLECHSLHPCARGAPDRSRRRSTATVADAKTVSLASVWHSARVTGDDRPVYKGPHAASGQP
eukprot:1260107-Amphidinium_carterae.2